MITMIQATIIVSDEVNCIVGGLHPDHINHFYNYYGRYTANYFYDTRYKLGRWDGKIRFFSKVGRTYLFLLDEIIQQLQALNYSIKLNDKRTGVFYTASTIDEHYFKHVIDPTTNSPLKLRYYQVEAINALLKSGTGILVAGTGSGKTYTTACLADVYGKRGYRTITIVPSSSLVEQTKRTFELCRLDTGEYSGSRKDVNHCHVVSTWQALNRNPDIMQAFTVVIVDECHQAKAAVLKKLLIDYGTHIVHRFGLTGTMPTHPTDALTIKCAIGPVRYTIKSVELMERNFLSSVDIEIIELQEDISSRYFVGYQDEKKYLQINNKRLLWIANFIHEKAVTHAERSNVLCLVNSIAVGRRLEQLIPGAIFVARQLSQEDRLAIFDTFKEQDNLKVISTVQLLGLGIDISRIFNLIYIDMGRSFIRTIQSIGRGLRIADDKHHVKVFDICSSLKYSRQHQQTRVSHYKQELFPYTKVNIKYL